MIDLSKYNDRSFKYTEITLNDLKRYVHVRFTSPIMSSFDELLVQTQRESESDVLYDALLELVMEPANRYTLSNRIFPFLQHVPSSSLNALCSQLQNPYDNNEILYRALVHNVVNESKSNPKIKQVIDALIGRS